MRILDARVRHGEVELKIPSEANPVSDRFRWKFFPDNSGSHAGYYYGYADGFVRPNHWIGRPDRGFGGRTVHITLEGGEERDLLGPFDVGSAPFHRLGCGPFMGVSWPCVFEGETVDEVWDRPGMFYGGYVLVDVVRQALAAYCSAWEVVATPIYRPDVGPGLSDEQMAAVVHGIQKPPNAVIYRVQEVK